jgi:RimJ/RimL family protein N-acetyltransferase
LDCLGNVLSAETLVVRRELARTPGQKNEEKRTLTISHFTRIITRLAGRTSPSAANKMIVIDSPRLQLSQFQMTDAEEVFACITPAITKFMRWEPPSWSEYIARCEERMRTPEPDTLSFVIRRRDSHECLGMIALENSNSPSPEMGLWIKESEHGQGFGREVVAALAEWAHNNLGKETFIYPVAVQNTASRRIAEGFQGKIIGNRTNPKYDSVVYKISWKA